MSLPNGFLDDLRARISLAQVVGRKVAWDLRKSNAGRGDWWAPCPFHQEKSASFHVDDRKGFYYCFGCHAKGDALTFLRETENMGFMEAVEQLAREAGLPMPAPDPVARARADRGAQLAEVMEQAVKFYRLQLKRSHGAEARAYLTRRGLTDAALDRWEIGLAPPGWQGLWDHLAAAGVPADLVLDAGLAKASERGRQPYDTFRNRIMFPIRDARGRAIAFGGRAMDPGDTAKYLNSPETALFDKGRTLFNIGPARSALAKGAPLIVAEGYMDVIALVGAGFEAAVAPLGTAITEEQLRLLWRLSDEPLIALDGDAAGLRAGQRLADLALGLIEAGQSLRFVLLPGGQDPDDLLRGPGGSAAFQRLIDAAVPMAQLLWDRETQGRVLDSPERRAALDRRLRTLAGRVRDPDLRRHYLETFRERARALFGSAPRTRGTARGAYRPPEPALAGTRGTVLASGADGVAEQIREARLLATLFAHPALIARFEQDLYALDPVLPAHRDLQRLLLGTANHPVPPEVTALAAQAGAALSNLLAQPHVAIAAQLGSNDPDIAERCLAEDFAILSARRAALREVAEAAADMDRLPDEGVTWRLGQAAAAVERASRPRIDDSTSDDERALSDHLQRLIEGQIWLKRRKP